MVSTLHLYRPLLPLLSSMKTGEGSCLSSFATLRMTGRGFVILSVAKDLWLAFVQQTWLTPSCGLMGNHQFLNS